MHHALRPPLVSRLLSFVPYAVLAGVLLTMPPGARAQITGAVATIRNFNGVNGQQAEYPLIEGTDGFFYGTTSQGGANRSGTIFRVSPDGTLTLLHAFDYAVDGASPQCSLVQARDGNFYGTTFAGGPNGGGTVFRATPDGTVTVLHAFGAPGDVANGNQPRSGLTQDLDGRLYGTTTAGGLNNDGTIFRLAADGSFTTLHTFTFHQTGAGPCSPFSSLVLGSDGNFYGVAAGGDNALGTIYKLTTDGVVTTVYSFTRSDGSDPLGPLTEGENGVFYGVTVGNSGYENNGTGTVFKITSDGRMTFLHAFTGRNFDGNTSNAGLVRGTDGNLYGTTRSGGSYFGGNIYQITPTGVVTTVYNFGWRDADSGYLPASGLVRAADGSFYGTTQSGGMSGYGIVYRMTLHPHPPFFDGEADLDNGVEYLAFPNGRYFGYFGFLSDPHYIYHFDLGYEYVFDAGDSKGGVYLYDFKSRSFFYTSPTFPFPYLYDFTLNTVLYYFPDPNNAGRYNTDGYRYFYNFNSGKVIYK